MKKIAISAGIILVAQAASALVCWFAFGEFFIIPTLIGSIFPVLAYLKKDKDVSVQ